MSRRYPHISQDVNDHSTVPDYLDEIQQNDNLISGLSNKVSTLKTVTLDIGDEIKYQNNYLKNMDNDFNKTLGFLSSSMARVKKLASAGHNRYIFYLILFSLFVFFFIFVMIRFN